MHEDLDKPEGEKGGDASCSCGCAPTKLEDETEAQTTKRIANGLATELDIQG